MPKNIERAALAEPYRIKRGNVTFIISSFGNPNTKNTAEDLILHIIETRIREAGKEVEEVD